MKNNIVVDDDWETRFPNVEARFIDNSVEAVAALAILWTRQQQRDSVLDELWLDHDLGPDDTIRPVVDWLLTVAKACDRPLQVGTIFVHSMNASIVESMVFSLRSAGYNAIRIPLPVSLDSQRKVI